MSLALSTLLTGLVVLAAGSLLAWNGPAVERGLRRGLRSEPVALVLFGAAAALFLWRIATLSPADFGNFKVPLFIAFGAVAVGAWFYVKDFLAVRGAAILILLASRELLDAAFLQEPVTRLIFVAFVYVAIVAALVAGTIPWVARNAVEWLYATPGRARPIGLGMAAFGLVLCLLPLTY